MKKIIIALSLLCCGALTSCATDPSGQDLRSPCVSIDHPHSPCARTIPAGNIALA